MAITRDGCGQTIDHVEHNEICLQKKKPHIVITMRLALRSLHIHAQRFCCTDHVHKQQIEVAIFHGIWCGALHHFNENHKFYYRTSSHTAHHCSQPLNCSWHLFSPRKPHFNDRLTENMRIILMQFVIWYAQNCHKLVVQSDRSKRQTMERLANYFGIWRQNKSCLKFCIDTMPKLKQVSQRWKQPLAL